MPGAYRTYADKVGPGTCGYECGKEFTQTRSGRGKIPRKIPRVWHYTHPTEHNLANFGMTVLDGSAKKTQDWLLTDWVVFFRASVNIKKCLKIPKIRGITL